MHDQTPALDQDRPDVVGEAGRELLDPHVADPREPEHVLRDAVAQDLAEDGRDLDPALTLLLRPTATTTQLRGRTHWRALCHRFGLGFGLAACGMCGCASEVGWSVTPDRTCSAHDPARVCSVVEPDFGHTLRLGDVELLPGECAAQDGAGRGGLIRMETRDPRGEGRHRSIRIPRSKVTILAIEEDGKPEVVERRTCDRTPISLD